MEKRATEFVGWRYIAQSIIHYTSSHLGWYCQRTEGSFFRTAPGWIRGRFLSYFAKELLFHWFSELNLCHQASHRKKPRHDTPSFAPCRKGKTKKKKKELRVLSFAKGCAPWSLGGFFVDWPDIVPVHWIPTLYTAAFHCVRLNKRYWHIGCETCALWDHIETSFGDAALLKIWQISTFRPFQ